jgi:molybdopterin molybdotransferase
MGLPGNPVSSFVTFLLAVAPVLRALQGADAALPAAGAAGRLRLAACRPRREFLRVRLNEHGGLDLFPNQSSGVLTSAVWADGLVDNPPARPSARRHGALPALGRTDGAR